MPEPTTFDEDQLSLFHEYLKQEAADVLGPGMVQLAYPVLRDPRFSEVPASLKYHHNYKHGLLEHTFQVVQYGMRWCFGDVPRGVDPAVVFLGCLWHDYGKCWDYVWTPDKEVPVDENVMGGPTKIKPGEWVETKHKKQFDHIARSALEWERHSSELSQWATKELREHVSHCILSHHQLREWGSPVRPYSPEAWVVHLSDMMSGFGFVAPSF